MLRRYFRAALRADIGVVCSVVALAVVLLIPALRTHHFTRFYRPVEAQATVRHWSLDLNDDSAARSINLAAETPSLTALVPPIVPVLRLESRDLVSPRVSVSRLLVRMRVGPSRASDPPLLS